MIGSTASSVERIDAYVWRVSAVVIVGAIAIAEAVAA
jgi:hypothetical protein